ncbi:unnamed protein product [Nezara viridula]|uniref:Uncharacterized protein n=1 Tax=Nezara viridula TaxID=85310 RepID=A0A9P0HCE6_NEZVI|nr:unnamed protein product [Nezara viridula]
MSRPQLPHWRRMTGLKKPGVGKRLDRGPTRLIMKPSHTTVDVYPKVRHYHGGKTNSPQIPAEMYKTKGWKEGSVGGCKQVLISICWPSRV